MILFRMQEIYPCDHNELYTQKCKMQDFLTENAIHLYGGLHVTNKHLKSFPTFEYIKIIEMSYGDIEKNKHFYSFRN